VDPLLAPAAERLGIDLIWFGVLICANIQTSFKHPPFGFALFYLRSVAPAKDFLDKVTGRLTKRVTTGQIYWGAVPFVLIQIIMIALVISFPQMVMVYKANEKTFDINKIRIEVPADESAPGNQPEGNPLKLFLDSLSRFSHLPGDLRVLPSHERVFHGVHPRIAALHAHHDERLARLLEGCAKPITAFDALPLLFKRKLDDHQMMFAMGEAIAHLHYLYNLGKVKRVMDNGVRRYVR